MLPDGCHLLSASRAPELLPDTKAFPKCDSQGHWPQGNCGTQHTDVAGAREAQSWPGGGVLTGPSTEDWHVLVRQKPKPGEGSLALGKNYANYLSGSCL